jgi:hypothetical protein
MQSPTINALNKNRLMASQNSSTMVLYHRDSVSGNVKSQLSQVHISNNFWPCLPDRAGHLFVTRDLIQKYRKEIDLGSDFV